MRTVAVDRRQLQALENAEFERFELRRNVNECIGASVCFGRVPIGRHEDTISCFDKGTMGSDAKEDGGKVYLKALAGSICRCNGPNCRAS